MGRAAYNTIIKASGSSVAMTDEPMSNTTGDTYRVTDAARRVLDPGATYSVSDDDGEIAASGYTIDYPAGEVTFDPAPSGAVTLSGKYFPMTAVAGAQQYSVDLTGDILDNTDFDASQNNSGYRKKMYGLLDVSVTVSRFYQVAKTFITKLKERERVFVEIYPGGGTEKIAGWFVIENANLSGSPGDLEQQSMTLQLDQDPDLYFSWSS